MSSSSRRLLLVDDDAVTRELLSLLLAAEGWEVLQAADGDAAVAAVGALTPDVCLCDLQMPGLSGSGLAAELRAKAPRAVVIAMTATAGVGAPVGFDALLLKPFAADAVDAVCRSVGGSGRAEVAVEVFGEESPAVIDATTLAKLRGTMPALQLQALYGFALDDAEKRIGVMESAQGDDATYRAEAHALKGSCGMVGAMQLRLLAAEAEAEGVSTWKRLPEFRAAVSEIRHILETISHDAVG